MSNDPNQRIAKNTLMLYFRMLITLGVKLYTSRVILNILGVEDYGIYNVVGGIVVMISFLNNAMALGTQRFLSIELGRANLKELAKVFSMSINIHLIIALVIFVLSETIGLWFLNTHLNIPTERLNAAIWAFHFSVLTFMISVFSIPFHSLIISYERMNIYAYVSIIEVSLKLLIVFMLQWWGVDKLVFYSVLVFLVSLLIRLTYVLYCIWKFRESRYQFIWDTVLFKTLINFAGWNLWGNAAWVISTQGINILLNIFFGPAINAARGIAYQVKAAIHQFATNFQLAIRPQIFKSFATNDLKYMHQLIFQGSKFSYFLLFLLSLPIFLETHFVLSAWLKIVPEYTVIFVQLIIINVLVDTISTPLNIAAQASGRIKVFEGVNGILNVLILPFSYLLLKLGFQPQVTLIISISVSTTSIFIRALILRKLIHFQMRDFFFQVIYKIILVSIMAIILPFIARSLMEASVLRFLLVGLISVICTLISIYFLGISSIEKIYIFSMLKKARRKYFPEKIIVPD